MGNNRFYRAALFCVVGWIAVSGLEAQEVGPIATPSPVIATPSPVIATPSLVIGDTSVVEGATATKAVPNPARPREDWSVLRVDPAELLPTATAVVGSGEYPGFTRELLRVQWRPGDPIDLYVIKPQGVKDPPVVLYLYNYTLDTDLFRNDGWCKRATQGGFAAVGFVSALAGQRYAYRPMKEWFVSELQESLGTTVHDVQMILNYLERRGDLDVSQVGMFGQGSGGAIAVLAAEADPRISALDVLNPWGDWPDWLKDSPQVPEKERAAYLTPEFLKRVENLDPILYLPKLNLKALRVEQVLDDLVTPAVAKQKIAASVQRPEQLVQYKDIFAEQDAWRVSGLSGWLHEQLRPSPPTQSGPGSQSVAPAVAGQNSSSAPQLKAVQ